MAIIPLMFESMIYFWLGFGVILVVAEVLLPGLVSIFVGFGALTVAALLHMHYIDNIATQLITWFISSTIYIFSLRLLVMRFYPSDTTKQDIDEDQAMIGQIAKVTQEIPVDEVGRISYGETTWNAIAMGEELIPEGAEVEIVGRKNISWLVKKK